MLAGICAMTTSGFLLGVPRADTLPGRPAYPSLQPMPRAARSSKTTAAVVMQNSDEPPEDLMSMNQHELEIAHSRALIEALVLKNEEIELALRGKCPVLAHAKAIDALDRTHQIEELGIELYGGDPETVEWVKWINEEATFERIVSTSVMPGTRDLLEGQFLADSATKAAGAPAEISEIERHRAVLETPAASKGPAFKVYWPEDCLVSSDVFSSRLMSMNQHELETAHFRALIDAHDLKLSVLLLDYDHECTVLACAKFNDAMERVMQIEVRGFERYGDAPEMKRRKATELSARIKPKRSGVDNTKTRSLGGSTRPIPKTQSSEGTVLPSEHGPGALGMMS